MLRQSLRRRSVPISVPVVPRLPLRCVVRRQLHVPFGKIVLEARRIWSGRGIRSIGSQLKIDRMASRWSRCSPHCSRVTVRPLMPMMSIGFRPARSCVSPMRRPLGKLLPVMSVGRSLVNRRTSGGIGRSSRSKRAMLRRRKCPLAKEAVVGSELRLMTGPWHLLARQIS